MRKGAKLDSYPGYNPYITPYKKHEELESLSTGSHLSKDKKRPYTKRTTEKVKRWTNEETGLYETFIKQYADVFTNNSSKRVTKIFILMADFIGTKTPSQCRSHHQKFFKKLMRINGEDHQKIKKNKKNNTTKVKLEVKNEEIVQKKTENEISHIEIEKIETDIIKPKQNYEIYQNNWLVNVNQNLIHQFELCEAENYHLEEKKRRKSSFLFNEVGKNQEMNFNNFEDILFNTSFKREAPEDFLMH